MFCRYDTSVLYNKAGSVPAEQRRNTSSFHRLIAYPKETSWICRNARCQRKPARSESRGRRFRPAERMLKKLMPEAKYLGWVDKQTCLNCTQGWISSILSLALRHLQQCHSGSAFNHGMPAVSYDCIKVQRHYRTGQERVPCRNQEAVRTGNYHTLYVNKPVADEEGSDSRSYVSGRTDHDLLFD